MHTFRVTATGDQGEGVTHGEATVKSWTKQAAFKKAAFFWAACWIGAVVSIIIPLVHFVTVPLGLLLGPILGFVVYKIYNGASDVEGGGAPCPKCKAPVPLARASERWPLSVRCPQCDVPLTFTKDGP